ncbi:hypothetical protein JB92DRAFT_2925294 [Gautieria morchelliformis]|nr:hypothetical protein JB92DRAFT_2925294 [Gautieria morchelliformis]
MVGDPIIVATILGQKACGQHVYQSPWKHIQGMRITLMHVCRVFSDSESGSSYRVSLLHVVLLCRSILRLSTGSRALARGGVFLFGPSACLISCTMANEQLPVAHLESLKYRVTQIMESITALQFLVDANGAPAMPPWPDILARYNLLLSQTHSLSVSLSFALAQHQQQPPPQNAPANPFQNLALHPGLAIPEQQLDNAVAPLLRNQPTMQVLREEEASVRSIAAVIKSATPEGLPAIPGVEGCEQVVQECLEVKRAHDSRVERAIKAVALLRDRYEWRARVEAGDEPEEQEQDEGGGGAPELDRELDREGDVVMEALPPPPEGGVVANARSSEASTPASARSDEANEARVTEDVLGGMGPTPG